jgi:hypothetical protein
MAMTLPIIHFAFPSLSPVGGVIKLMDYVRHARDAGYETVIVVDQPYDAALPLFTLPRFMDFLAWDVPIVERAALCMRDDNFYFFSWPPDFAAVEPLLPWLKTDRIIHIVQGIRHTYPRFLDGYAFRLLSRPMTRIAISDHVRSAIVPYVNPSSILRTIPLAHPTDFFRWARDDGHWHNPIRVAYTTWKSDVGVAIEKDLVADKRFEFRRVDGRVQWHDLRKIYHWADIFLCCPRIEEGFYLPGLEAMAAECVVVTPDVVGNREYCQFGTNCIQVEWGNVASYRSALEAIAAMSPARRRELRAAGAVAAGSRDLAAERDAFANLLADPKD